MRNKQVKELRKAIRESLKDKNISPEKYSQVYGAIYKQAKREFKDTSWNKKNEIQI